MKSKTSRLLGTAAIAICFAAGVQAQDLPPLTADDLLFSVDNMDLSADPKEDFYRFAAGGWLDRVERPADKASYSFVSIQLQRITDQVKAVVVNAAEEAADAPKGSPTQLVGDFYTAYMDVDRRNANGMAPLQEEFDRIAAIDSLEELGRYSAHALRFDGLSLFAGFSPQADLADSTRYAIYSGPGGTGIEARDVYASEDGSPRRAAYRKYVNDLLTIAGYDPAEAKRVTGLVLELETAFDAAQLSDAEKLDFQKLNNRMSVEETQALIPNFDIPIYLEELGLDLPEEIIVTQPDYLIALSKMLEERPLQDFKDYAKFRLIDGFASVLSTDFEEPIRARREVFEGVPVLRPRDERALERLQGTLGHPLSQLYVDAYYEQETRDKTLELIDYIVAAFEKRIPTRDWLTEDTKAAALEKLQAFENKVGYPEQWIDYSSVEIVPDDPVANLLAVTAFGVGRELARYGGPVENDDFNKSSTLPVALNAAYVFALNGFRVTAAISQPPAFEPDADPAIRFCRFGGIIGHEATHGFDTAGRQFDANGNLRNWWTEEDTQAFVAEAKKLVDQTENTELVEGHTGNGALWVTENMADVGGIKLGYSALMDYLADHPEEDVEIDGFTQAQRCFIGWAQLWAENATEASLVNYASSANHPPNIYRTTAPLQHFDVFYEAFGIEEGDPMWLPPEKRVHAW